MVEMNEQLEAFMKERLGVSAADVEKMSPEERYDLLLKAAVIEEIEAVKDEGDEPGEDLTMAADIVDWIHGPYTKRYD